MWKIVKLIKFSFFFFNNYDVENCETSKVRCHNIMKSTKGQRLQFYIIYRLVGIINILKCKIVDLLVKES